VGTPADGILSFTILTTDAGAATRHLHDRMPVILDWSGFAGWLQEGAVASAANLDKQVHLLPVSRQVRQP
jgi:putative SOS response-associated peptidase YedK